MTYQFTILNADQFNVLLNDGTRDRSVTGGRAVENNVQRNEPGYFGEPAGGGDYFTIELPTETFKFRRSEVSVPVTVDDDALELFLQGMVKGSSGGGGGDATLLEQEAQTAVLEDTLDGITDLKTLVGHLTETQPTEPNDSSGLNGRLQYVSNALKFIGIDIGLIKTKLMEIYDRLTDRTQKTQLTNGTTDATFTGNKLDVQVGNSSLPVTGTFFPATQPVSGTFFQATQPVSAVSLPLPTGAATSALQTTGNISVGNVDTNIGAVGNSAATNSTSSWSVIALLKGIYALLNSFSITRGTTGVDAKKVAADFLAGSGLNTTSLSVLAAVADRKAVTFFNDTNKTIYLAFGFTAVGTDSGSGIFTVKLVTGALYEVPSNLCGLAMNASIKESSVTGTLQITTSTT